MVKAPLSGNMHKNYSTPQGCSVPFAAEVQVTVKEPGIML